MIPITVPYWTIGVLGSIDALIDLFQIGYRGIFLLSLIYQNQRHLQDVIPKRPLYLSISLANIIFHDYFLLNATLFSLKFCFPKNMGIVFLDCVIMQPLKISTLCRSELLSKFAIFCL